MGMITPPVDMNVFVVKGIAPDVPMATIFCGVLPFLLAMFVCLILIVIFLQIALFPPNAMFGSGCPKTLTGRQVLIYAFNLGENQPS